jgi:hypothetical protein
MFLQRGIMFTHEAVRAEDSKLTLHLPEALRKRRHGLHGTGIAHYEGGLDKARGDWLGAGA